MITPRSIRGLVLGAGVLWGMSYCTYGFLSAPKRVTRMCAGIPPGMAVAYHFAD